MSYLSKHTNATDAKKYLFSTNQPNLNFLNKTVSRKEYGGGVVYCIPLLTVIILDFQFSFNQKKKKN